MLKYKRFSTLNLLIFNFSILIVNVAATLKQH